MLSCGPPLLLSQSPWCLVCVSLFSPCSLRKAAYTAALALDTLSSVATNSDTATATIDPAQDSPSSETTTLTCSLSTPANEPSPTPVLAPAPTPESNTAPPPPLVSTAAVEAKMAPLIEQRGRDAPEEQEKLNTPPCTPEQIKPQKSGTPIPPKRRHSPKLAALNAKSSPPVSPLAVSPVSSSPTLDNRKPAPSPPVTKPPTQPNTVALNPEPPVQTASCLATTAPAPDPDSKPTAPDSSGRSLTAFNKDKTVDQTVDSTTPTARVATTSSPAVIHGVSEDLDAVNPGSLVSGIPSPLPVTPIPSNPVPVNLEALPSNNLLISASDTYDLLTPDMEPKNADLDLEMINGTERPSMPPVDLISLDSPPAAPSLPNGDEADPPSGPVLQPSETLAKTAPPVNDEYGSL